MDKHIPIIDFCEVNISPGRVDVRLGIHTNTTIGEGLYEFGEIPDLLRLAAKQLERSDG